MSLGCGSEEALKENIFMALKLEGIEAYVNFHRIDDSEADSLGLRGSPSVLIDGKDIQPAEVKGFS